MTKKQPTHADFESALALHQSGDLIGAHALYRRCLQNSPGHVNALHLMGVLLTQQGRAQEGLHYLRAALKLCPREPNFLSNLGIALRQCGQLHEALSALREALVIDPENGNALVNLGNVLQDLNRHQESIHIYQQALEAHPNHLDALRNMGTALHALGHFAEAKAIFERALLIRPGDSQTQSNLGITHEAMGEWEEAERSYLLALGSEVSNAVAFFNLGTLQKKLGRFHRAKEYLLRATVLRPNWTEALNNLGAVYEELGQPHEAEQCFSSALHTAPNNSVLWSNLGNALRGQKRFIESLDAYLHALECDPANVESLNNLGATLHALDFLDAAAIAFEQVLFEVPDHASALYNLGITEHERLNLDAAIHAYQACIDSQESNARMRDLSKRAVQTAEARWNLSLSFLLNGDLEHGFFHYENRWDRGASPPNPVRGRQPSSLKQIEGCSILVHSEQGLGDTIQFARYLPRLTDLCSKVHFSVPTSLHGLMGKLVPHVSLEPLCEPKQTFDWEINLLSLPHLFRTTLQSIPPPLPSRESLAVVKHKWALKLGVKRTTRIALAWSGAAHHPDDRHRSMSLGQFAQALPMNEFEYHCAQDKVREGDLRAMKDLGIHTHFQDLSNFLETAGLLLNMDIVITVDTSVAHLAGSIGIRTVLLLQHVPDWRWLLRRDSSPWYPSVTLVRQESRGDWISALSAVHALLGSHLPSLPPSQNRVQGAREIARAVNRIAVRTHQNQGIGNALPLYHQAIELDPEEASYQSNLSLALMGSNDFDGALRHANEAVRLAPKWANGHYNQGVLLRRMAKDRAAKGAFENALACDPSHAKAALNLGNTLRDLEEFVESSHAFTKATEIDPTLFDAWLNLGNIKKRLGRFGEAISAYNTAMRIRPEDADARFNLSLVQLLLGDYKLGWKNYEARLKTEEFSKFQGIPHARRWNGRDSLRGKKIILWAEQGFGDTLQFSRYALQIELLGAEVHIFVPDTLTSVIQTISPTLKVWSSINAELLQQFDFWSPLLSLPGFLHPDQLCLPTSCAYLKAPQHVIHKWHDLFLSEPKGLKIGISWQGRPSHKHDQERSIHLGEFLVGMPEVATLYPLNPSGPAGDPASLGDPRIRDFRAHIKNFGDTAALIMQMDLVVTVDTSVSHLSGGLGMPTFVLVPKVPDWRWGLGGKVSAWYPKCFLFRQTKPNSWESVFKDLNDTIQSNF